MILQIRNWAVNKQIIIFFIGFFIQLPFQSIKAEVGIKRKYDLNQDDSSQQSFGSSSPFVPGDAIMVSTFPDTASFLNQSFPISDRGFIELPIYGKVRITDMSKAELENFIEEKFRDYLRFPYVQIKPLIRVSILGGVPNPGLYYFDPDRSLWQLVYMAGGTVDEDGLKDMKWERNRDAVKKNLIPYLQNGISLKNMGFQSGDQILVKTPGKPGFIEKLSRFFPIFTFATSVFTFYYTYQILLEDRRAGRARGAIRQ